VPAAAVIPASLVYINIAVVKKFVVGVIFQGWARIPRGVWVWLWCRIMCLGFRPGTHILP